MITTVTPNPSLDRALQVPDLERGSVIRSGRAIVDPGGKGINVARALVANGQSATAVVPVGGPEGTQLVALLRARGVEPVTTAISGAVRANITLVEPDGTTTKVNEPGPVLDPDEVEALLAAAAAAAAGTAWVASCGSLPAGAPDDLHAQVSRRAHAAGARTAIDTSGPPLLAALAAGPDLIKPNAEELGAATGLPLRTLADVAAACAQLRGRGAQAVLASLGPDGALLVTADVVLHGHAAAAVRRSTVGAGDAALAGYLAAGPDAPPAHALRLAIAYGTAAVQLAGSAMPGPHDLDPDAVQVTEDPDLTRPLTQPVDVAVEEEGARAGVC